MPSLFMSYRRADSMEVTGRIYDRLAECFGQQSVFRDIDSIPLGVPFKELLVQTLSRTDAALVIIGPAWLTVSNDHGRPRLMDPVDYVRLEVETALQTGHPVIPVIVSNASLPKETELPDAIRSLAQRNSISVRPDPDFHRDVDRLCFKIQEVLGLPSEPVRKSEAVDSKLAEITNNSKRLQAELELQETLASINSEWEEERERQKIRISDSGPEVPTHAWIKKYRIFFIIALLASLFFLTKSVMEGNLDATPAPIIIFLTASGYWIYSETKYRNYEKVRIEYERRRAEAKHRFDEQIAAIDHLNVPDKTIFNHEAQLLISHSIKAATDL
jgi:hypothetical protein